MNMWVIVEQRLVGEPLPIVAITPQTSPKAPAQGLSAQVYQRSLINTGLAANRVGML